LFSTTKEEKADAADIDSPMDAFLGIVVDAAVIILEHDDLDDRCCVVVTKAQHDDDDVGDGDDVIKDIGSLPIRSLLRDDDDDNGKDRR